MPTVEDLERLLLEILDNTETLLGKIVISASQVRTDELSAITANLGLAVAGEFRSGTGDPSSAFTGVRVTSPGVLYNGVRYAISGWNAGVFKFGLSAQDGTITATGSVQSDNFVTGVSGWRIDNAGKAEFQDVLVRGTIESSIFKYGEISAVGGNVLLTKSASRLFSDATLAATTFSVIVVDDGQSLVVNDILRIKTENIDVWMKIDSIVDNGDTKTLSVTRQSGTSSGVVSAGAAVVNYGVAASGVIDLSATLTNGPRIDIGLASAAPWTSLTQLVRLGNLNGSFGFVTNTYGFGFGDYTNGSYLTYDGSDLYLQGALGGVRLSNSGLVLSSRSNLALAVVVERSAIRFKKDGTGDTQFTIQTLFDDNGGDNSVQVSLSAQVSSSDPVRASLELISDEVIDRGKLKFTTNDVEYVNWDQWIRYPLGWTRVSNTSFTSTGDVRSIFPIGTKLRVTDTTTKYFSVVAVSYSSPDTTVTITGGTDYLLAATPTDRWFSYDATPQGFPDFFSWTPTFTGFSTNPVGIHRFKIVGKEVRFYVKHISGTSNQTFFTLTLPVASGPNGSQSIPMRVVDNGANLATPGLFDIPGSSSLVSCYTTLSGLGWTNSNTKYISGLQGFYTLD